MDAFARLPDEIKLRILCELSCPELGVCARVCRSWYALAGDFSVWQACYQRTWPHAGEPLAVTLGLLSWREFFRLRWRLDVLNELGLPREESSSSPDAELRFVVRLHETTLAPSGEDGAGGARSGAALDEDGAMERLLLCHELTCALVRTARHARLADTAQLDTCMNFGGRVLRECAERCTTLGTAMALFDASDSVYERAAKLEPVAYWVFNNWALGLKNRSLMLEMRGYRDDALFWISRACALCSEAVAMQSQSDVILSNFGRMLREFALLVAPRSELRARLMAESCLNYKAAHALIAEAGSERTPAYHAVLNNLGRAFRDVALECACAEDGGRPMFELSCAMYDQAIAVRPNHRNAMNNKGISILAWGTVLAGAAAQTKFDEAREIFTSLQPELDETGAVISPASRFDRAAAELLAQRGEQPLIFGDDDDTSQPYWWALYSLARLHAVCGEGQACRRVLTLFLARRTLSAYTLGTEDKFARVRDEPWFVKLAADLRMRDIAARQGARFYQAERDDFVPREPDGALPWQPSREQSLAQLVARVCQA